MPDLQKIPGSLIGGRYLLDRQLGQGGMGEIWAATHFLTRRSVAIKFLKRGRQHNLELRQRLIREAEVAGVIRHPNVVEVLDLFDLEDGTPVMVMELLEGETLGTKLEREERLSVEETASLLLPVISAVRAAHTKGVVHRDLKPDNIFLARKDGELRVKILDFGIAKLTAEHAGPTGSPQLTHAGSILGTPAYMAPEQVANQDVDYRADIWSLGVILYECLSGSRPIEGQNTAEVIARVMGSVIMPLDSLAKGLPCRLTALVERMLKRDLTRRLSDLTELDSILASHASHALSSDATLISNATLVSAPTVAVSVVCGAVATRARPSPEKRAIACAVLGVAVASALLMASNRPASPPPLLHAATLSVHDESLRGPVPVSRKRAATNAPATASSTPDSSETVSAASRSHPRRARRTVTACAVAMENERERFESTLFAGRK
jgi:eukaryotic-like serine/threonine-protein kinase